MINIINTASDAMINPSTVTSVGICFYDYEEESIKELSSVDINMCSVSPFSPVIKKYYLICNDSFSYVNIKILSNIDNVRYFGAKIITNEIEPVVADFLPLTEFNTAKVLNPLMNHLVPVYILIYPKVSANINLEINIEIEAD